jgi:hypothetical protein
MRKASSVTRLSLAVTLVVMVQGCDSAPPAPSEVRQPTPELPAPLPPGMTRVTGLVVEPGGQAVPGAVITRLYGGAPTTTVTSATGAYELTLDAQPPEIVRLTVEKEGFEPSVLFIAPEGKGEERRDLHLHRILRIAVGESVRLSIGQSDSFCGPGATEWGHDANARPCRRIRVVSLSEGRLDIWVKGADVEPQYRIQLAANPQEGRRSYFSTPVDAGSETVVDLVLMDGPGPFLAELETRLSGWWDY